MVANDWMSLVLDLTKDGKGFTPPVAARAFGYIGLTLYQSVLPGMPEYKSMEGQVNGLDAGSLPQPDADELYNWAIVANTAVATAVRACFSNASDEQKAAIDALESKWISAFPDTKQKVIDRSVNFGKDLGSSMVVYAASDDQADCFNKNFPADYIAPTGEGLWVPTPPAYQTALQPYWKDVRPFITQNVGGALPIPPPTFSRDPNSAFWGELVEVYDAVNNLTAEQMVIAEYWSDDPGLTATPPGHSLSILIQVLQQENANLDFAAEAFAKLGMAVHDAFVSCWNAKFTYNLVRPITIIHEDIDPNFSIPLNTPPFPEYTSGHSVQSGAAAQVLTDLFGDNYAFVDHTHEARTDIDGSARSFTSFYDFADEAAISRLYGGIHYRAAIEVGVSQGKIVGTNIGALDFK
ncbi:MAG: vanadium-dependent haloperoxidase [Bacteroidia bacterium]